LHFGLTLEGLQLTELQLAELNRAAPKPSSVEGRLIGPSIQALDAHMARLAKRPPRRREGPGRIPRHILQYWNTGKPPTALEAIMRSWQAAEGYAYHLFDRPAALRFLADELGADWAAALRLANHPAEQSDFFRLCFLAVKGGIYADCDDRLISSLDELTMGEAGLVVFRERRGAIANNLLLAEPAHPVVIHAAVAAKQALLRKDNDSVWTKTGPGLLTRSVAVACEEAGAREADPGVTIHTMLHAARHVQCHIPLPYKRTAGYWNAGSSGAHLAPMAVPGTAELVAANTGPPPMGQA
jgi:mannosyltransferase OCH1-like enzyme